MTNVVGLLDHALRASVVRHPELHRRWVAWGYWISGGAGLTSAHSDYRIDLLLRSVENEMIDLLGTEDGASFATDIHVTLTRYWVLSTYEQLRVARSRPRHAGNKAIASVLELLELVRMPLAKNEIAKTNRKHEPISLYRAGDDPSTAVPYVASDADYMAPTFFDRATGSIGWHVIALDPMRVVPITRRRISDDLLALSEAS